MCIHVMRCVEILSSECEPEVFEALGDTFHFYRPHDMCAASMVCRVMQSCSACVALDVSFSFSKFLRAPGALPVHS